MIVGFTGTREGMSVRQYWCILDWFQDKQVTAVHHGCCIGADAEFAGLIIRHRIGKTARKPWAPLHGHPSNLANLTDQEALAKADVRYKELPPLDRNQDIVDACSFLLACPHLGGETARSGTWATIRYAIKAGVPVLIIGRDGAAAMRQSPDANQPKTPVPEPDVS